MLAKLGYFKSVDELETWEVEAFSIVQKAFHDLEVAEMKAKQRKR